MDCMSPLREHASGLVEVYFVEFIALALELEGCSDAEHDLDGAGEDVKCLYCLMLYVLMLDECRCLLRAAEEDVHDLLCLH